MESSSLPELELPTIRLALAGDTAALTRLYASYHPLVLRTAERTLVRLRLADPSDELAAEVWLHLLEHGCRALRAFDPARGTFRGFMKMLAWQHALAVARRWKRHAFLEGASPSPEPLAPCATMALHHRMLLDRVLAAVPRVSPLDLTLLEEVLLWQTPVRELAPRLGCSTNALYKRNERLRSRLRAAGRALESRLHA